MSKQNILTRTLGGKRYFVISGGKTGSTTLEESLKRAGAIRAHVSVNFVAKNPQLKIHHLTLGDLISHYKELHHRKPLILTSYREPISRTISSFFQNLPQKSWSIPELTIHFYKTFFLTHENWQSFDDLDVFQEINVLSKPFNHEAGYQYYENERARVLLLHFERIGEWPRIIPPHLDQRDHFQFRPTNQSKSKWYAVLYTQFKRELRIPRDLLEIKFRLQNKYLQHFYTPEALGKLQQNWYSTSSDPILPPNFNWKSYYESSPELKKTLPLDEALVTEHWIRSHK